MDSIDAIIWLETHDDGIRQFFSMIDSSSTRRTFDNIYPCFFTGFGINNRFVLLIAKRYAIGFPGIKAKDIWRSRIVTKIFGNFQIPRHVICAWHVGGDLNEKGLVKNTHSSE